MEVIMSEPFIGEIKMFGFSYAPQGWALCDGQILPITQHYSLYALLGVNFGGDGQTTFALPDMRGRVPMHMGPGYYRGDKGGIERVPLAHTQIPIHKHAVPVTTGAGDSSDPSGKIFAGAGSNYYADSSSGAVHMNTTMLDTADGGGQAHNNVQPIQVINFSIALDGLFPPRS